VPEEGLDLGGVGSALAEARAEGVAAAVGTQSGDAGAAPAASTTWVMPEMVSGPRCPGQAGPGWRPGSSSQAEIGCSQGKPNTRHQWVVNS